MVLPVAFLLLPPLTPILLRIVKHETLLYTLVRRRVVNLDIL